jgi:hypothetical protein
MDVAKQQEVGINIERGKPEIQIDNGIHLMEQLVMATDVEPSRGHVWTPIKIDVIIYHETIAPSTRALEIENFQLQRTIEDLVESSKRATSEIDDSDHSLMINLCGEHDSC